MIPRLFAMSLILGATALAACGSQANLEPPAPMFGGGAQESPDEAAARAASDRARSDGAAQADPQAPQSAEEQSNWQRGDVPPPRSAPIEGMSPDPNAAQPPGALPDPYNYPGQSPGP